MNYLFEAIESERISKTMGFIDNESRAKFMEWLKKLSKKFDFPLSKFKDDYFQYLPFYKALALNSEIKEQICEAKSTDCFPSHGVEGEVCQSGKIKRKWGSGIRTVDCPSCDGTGKLRRKGGINVKWMKFWFSKDGKFETVTISDGSVVNSVDVRGINPRDVSSIPHLSQVTIKMERDGRYSADTEGIIYNRGDGVYFIHNNPRYDGGAPGDDIWRNYGSYSWSLGGGDYKDIQLLATISDNSFSEYNINYVINDRFNKVGTNVQKALQNSAFAIVLDYSEFEKSLDDVVKLSTIISDRKEQKKDALKLRSDKDIRNENIKRYISGLKVNIDMENLSNVKRLIIRILGWKMIGVYVIRDRGLGNIEEIVQRLFHILNGRDVEHHIEVIEEKVKRSTDSNLTFNNHLLDNLKKLEMHSEDGKIVADGFAKINNYLYNYIDNLKIENIEDIDNIYFTLSRIRSVFESSYRYDSLNSVYARIANVLEDDFNSDILPRLTRHESKIIKATEEIDKINEYL